SAGEGRLRRRPGALPPLGGVLRTPAAGVGARRAAALHQPGVRGLGGCGACWADAFSRRSALLSVASVVCHTAAECRQWGKGSPGTQNVRVRIPARRGWRLFWSFVTSAKGTLAATRGNTASSVC